MGLHWHFTRPEASTLGPFAPRSLPSHRRRRKTVPPLDDGTLSVIKAWRATQAQERLVMGAGWAAGDYVFTWPTGTPISPAEGLRLVP